MSRRPPKSGFEARWPLAVTALAVLFLLVSLPDRIRLFPVWGAYALSAVVLLSMAATSLATDKRPWLTIEHVVVLVFVVVVGAGMLVTLADLVRAMLGRSGQVSGLRLLTSSVAVWVTNVLVFSLLYWQIDRGGPESRISDGGSQPHWLFPQEGAPSHDVPRGWHPAFVDYLYLSYSTATAFSATDTVPLTSHAKLLMMLQSGISLVTLVLVASRAINILGS